jgi:hypothetical protein
MNLRVFLPAALAGAILAGCSLPTGSEVTVECENQNAGASVKCPDSNFVVPPPPAEQKKGG